MSQTDEYYVIRLSRRTHQPRGQTDGSHDIFLSAQGTPGHLSKAQRFVSIEQAEDYLSTIDNDQYDCHIQFCSTLLQQDDEQSQITARLMQIPYPYRRTAYNWMRGVDVESLLRSESDEVYERHRKMLLDYEMDIGRASDVILMSGRRQGRKKTSFHPQLPANAPRQFFATPAQRPVKKTEEPIDEDP